MWRAPTEVSTELGPRTGRSGDSPVSDGASAGSAFSSERRWSGWEVTTNASLRVGTRICQTSPNRCWALSAKLIGRGAPRLSAAGVTRGRSERRRRARGVGAGLAVHHRDEVAELDVGVEQVKP